jgi:hypothetical protein
MSMQQQWRATSCYRLRKTKRRTFGDRARRKDTPKIGRPFLASPTRTRKPCERKLGVVNSEKLKPTIFAQSVTWGYLEKCKGKTIADVEYGFEEPDQSEHQSESIRIHFTDGTAVEILVNVNTQTLKEQFPKLKLKDVHADILLRPYPAS